MLEKAVPISLEACLPISSVVWHQLENGGVGSRAESSLQFDPTVNLSQAWCPLETEENGPGASHIGSHRFLEHCDQFDGDIRCLKDWQQGPSWTQSGFSS